MSKFAADQPWCIDIWKDSREITLHLYRAGADRDDYEEARLSLQIWRTISSIALGSAPAGLKRIFNSVIPLHMVPVTLSPASRYALSLMRLARIVQGLGLTSARRIAEAWMRVPLHVRANGEFIYDDEKVVQIQLLSLVKKPSLVIAREMPQDFPAFIETIHYAGLTLYAGPYWACARTPLGLTAVAFDNMCRDDFYGSVAVSDAQVSFRCAIGDRHRKAATAVDFLMMALPKVIDDQEALELSGWVPNGHAVMELAAYLESLKSRISGHEPR